ncbi:MAG: formylglycine-generating enzyme family protein [Betaproteobacteria bacterium]|nr:formylglycine-generating enzyme family protein [Betaproteobacteria bacterium]MDE2056278.1 formylglycine-generating enzyme family protein [Betaproteobacteria bacterium]
MANYNKKQLSPEERRKRKRYLHATIVTCVIAVMIGSTLHVIKLGSIRMEDMRNLATYNLQDESKRIRAAGEDITLQEKHEHGHAANRGYNAAEIEQLLSREQWADVETMVKVAAGGFIMGTNLERADVQDKPQHTVTLPTYYIDKYLVTNAQYAKFVYQSHHRPPLNWKNGRIPNGEKMHPVTMVTWYDAKDYCKWDGKRLPTEAEFEKAARGQDGRRWPWGNIMDPKNVNTYYDVGSATDVGAFPTGVSPYGAMDMAGNVDEWVDSEFLPYKGSSAPSELFQGKVSVQDNAQDQQLKISDQINVKSHYKVLRGGSWKGDPFSTSSFHRNFAFANYASDFYGFRCASDSPAKGH